MSEINKSLIELIRKLAPERVAEELCSVQPMPNIDFAAMCDEDFGIDVTWMMIHGYNKVVEPFGHHGFLKTVRWVKNVVA
jgi:hypothetical protein